MTARWCFYCISLSNKETSQPPIPDVHPLAFPQRPPRKTHFLDQFLLEVMGPTWAREYFFFVMSLEAFLRSRSHPCFFSHWCEVGGLSWEKTMSCNCTNRSSAASKSESDERLWDHLLMLPELLLCYDQTTTTLSRWSKLAVFYLFNYLIWITFIKKALCSFGEGIQIHNFVFTLLMM